MTQNWEPVADVTMAPWPGNAEGTELFTRPTMARFIREDGDLPEIKELASEALEQGGWPATDRGKAEALCAYARRKMHYVWDMPYRESVYRPRYLLCARGSKLCVKIGDCGNLNCALGALFRAAGFDVKVQGIDYGPGIQPHVNIIVLLRDERNTWAEADATTDKPVGYVSPGRKEILDPHDPAVTGAGANVGAFIGAAGAFVGAGKAWDDASVPGYAAAITGYARPIITLGPKGRFRPNGYARLFGAGAPTVVLQPCDTFQLTLDVSAGGNPLLSLPSSFQVGLSGPVTGGQQVFDCTFLGSSPLSVPASFTASIGPISQQFSYPVLNVSIGPRSTTGPCQLAHHGGMWPSVGIATGFQPVGGGGSSTFTQQSGRRILRFVSVAAGKLPSQGYADQTKASVQSSLDAAFPGQYNVVSVIYPATSLPPAVDTMEIVVDYCGPTKTFPAKTTVIDNGVAITTTFKDAGPALTCGSGSSTGKKVLIAGGIAAALVAVAVGAHYAGAY